MSFSDQDKNYIRDVNSVSDVVGRYVRLVRQGREHGGLCPFHNEKTPSFTVNDDKGFNHCFGCGAHGDVIKFVMDMSNLSFPDAMAALGAGESVEPDAALQKKRRQAADRRAAQDKKDKAYKLTVARRIWSAAHDITGTVGEIYLRGRGIIGKLPPSLRFCHDAGYYENGRQESCHPAIISAVSHGSPGVFMGVHMTFLRVCGSGKADVAKPKKILGAVSGGAIRLGPVTPTIHIAEGIETALSVRDGVDAAASVWAGMSSSLCQTLDFPDYVKTIYHWIDHDKKQEKFGCGAGEQAARILSARMGRQGRKFFMVRPPLEYGDFNDVVTAGLDISQREGGQDEHIYS